MKTKTYRIRDISINIEKSSENEATIKIKKNQGYGSESIRLTQEQFKAILRHQVKLLSELELLNNGILEEELLEEED